MIHCQSNHWSIVNPTINQLLIQQWIKFWANHWSIKDKGPITKIKLAEKLCETLNWEIEETVHLWALFYWGLPWQKIHFAFLYRYYFDGVLVSSFGIVGFIGNLLTLFVLSRPKFKVKNKLTTLKSSSLWESLCDRYVESHILHYRSGNIISWLTCLGLKSLVDKLTWWWTKL